MLSIFSLNKPSNGKSYGFSIAEAMMALLVVSVALAAAAPLISRQVKNSHVAEAGAIPPGAIMLFDSNRYAPRGCPSGWTNISNANSGYFLKINSSVDAAGTREDAVLPEHKHPFGAWRDNGDNDADFFVDSAKLDRTWTAWRVAGEGDGTYRYIYGNKGGHYKWLLVTGSELYGSERIPNLPDFSAFFGDGFLKPTTTFNDLQPKALNVVACRKD